MGLFEKIFPNKTAELKDAAVLFQTLNGYTPVFKSWNGAIYESLLVRAAIDALARHTAKLKPEISGSARPILQTKLKRKPNPYQTWSQFLYQCRTICEVDTTLCIVPIFDIYGEITGMYPVIPTGCEVVESNGQIYLKYRFRNGKAAAVELDKCAIVTRFQYNNDFFGGGNAPLDETMDLISIQNQGIKEGVKSSASFRFMAQIGNFQKPEDLRKEQKRFSKNLKEKGGFLLFPNTYNNIKQIESKPFVVDAKQQEMIETNVNNYFGVNKEILQNKAVGDSWSAFYEGGIEPFSIQLSECITSMLFTEKEQAFGAGIMFTSNRLQYMSNSDKLKVSAQMADRGIMNRDEVRDIWNLSPLPNGEGQAYTIRGEYHNAADQLEDDDPDEKEDNEDE
ncbi:MAG: phage portal protein [Bacteroidales bacterium]|nr:phage portal protein [Acidaminococcaceae bacterium]MBR5014512.1 phage portal protein [Bacteroidales bacterium]